MMLPLLLAAAAAATPTPLTSEAQVKELCSALDGYASVEGDPAQVAEAQHQAEARRTDVLARTYRVEIPSKGFAFGRYRPEEKLQELDGDRPVRALDGALALDLEGIDDVAFHALPAQVAAWVKEKKDGTLRLVVTFKPMGERCAGSAAAHAFRLAGRPQSWQIAGEGGTFAEANAEGEPVGAPPKGARIETVALENDEEAHLAAPPSAFASCVQSAQRSGNLVVSFSIAGGHVRDAQVIMDSVRDEKVAACVAHAMENATVKGAQSGRGTASIWLE